MIKTNQDIEFKGKVLNLKRHMLEAIDDMTEDEALEFYNKLKDKIKVKLRKDKLNKL
jgi:hypothetical protein